MYEWNSYKHNILFNILFPKEVYHIITWDALLLAWKLAVLLSWQSTAMTDIKRNIHGQFLKAGEACLGISFNYFNRLCAFPSKL